MSRRKRGESFMDWQYRTECEPRGHIFTWREDIQDWACDRCLVARALAPRRETDILIQPSQGPPHPTGVIA